MRFFTNYVTYNKNGNVQRKRTKKTKCVPGTEVVYKTKENSWILKYKCVNCGIMKHSFLSNEKQGGSLDVHNLIGKLPRPKGGFTLPGHKYIGLYNLPYGIRSL